MERSLVIAAFLLALNSQSGHAEKLKKCSDLKTQEAAIKCELDKTRALIGKAITVPPDGSGTHLPATQ